MLVSHFQRLNMRLSAVYLIESQFMEDKYKFFRHEFRFVTASAI
jgi:hypothetical protein